MTKTVDSYRFISGITKRMIKSWISMERPLEIPWTPLGKPLAGCTVSLISSERVVTCGPILGSRWACSSDVQAIVRSRRHLAVAVDRCGPGG